MQAYGGDGDMSWVVIESYCFLSLSLCQLKLSFIQFCALDLKKGVGAIVEIPKERNVPHQRSKTMMYERCNEGAMKDLVLF